MNKTKIILLFCWTVLLPSVILCQSSKNTHLPVAFSDPSLPVITNRLNDTLSDDCFMLLNVIDFIKPLRIYEYNHTADSTYCNEIKNFDNYKALSDANNDWLVFVHGDNKTFSSAALSGLEIQNLHHVKVLVFSWPSKMENGNGLKNFKNSKLNAAAGVGQFKELLLLIQEYKKRHHWPEKPFHFSLFFHSLGNYYLERLVKDSLLTDLDSNLFDNLIINAAAINQEAHASWVDRLNIQKRIYIISNKQDFSLNGLRIFSNSGKQLGERLKLPLSSGANYINFTKAIGFTLPTSDSHTYFVGKMTNESGNIKDFYTDLFHGRAVNLSDSTRFIRRNDGLGYNILFK
ncbi:MAG: alpha/beta hydrolase [Bacteroidales bacterium]|nr:alpha/beta hydrolase [Bacteroidales bacterium]